MNEGCEKTLVEPVVTASEAGKQLEVIFSVDSSECTNESVEWWIIVVPIVCGLILLAVVFVLIVCVSPTLRKKVFPYRERYKGGG